MKKLIIAALLVSAAQPACAADFAEARDQKAGAFAGFRLRVPLGGDPRSRQIRAGLTLAPTLHVRDMRSGTRARIGEGLEFGYRSNRPLSLSIAGRDLQPRRLGVAQDDDNDDGRFSAGVIIAAGVAVVVIGGAIWFYSAITDCDPGDEC